MQPETATYLARTAINDTLANNPNMYDQADTAYRAAYKVLIGDKAEIAECREQAMRQARALLVQWFTALVGQVEEMVEYENDVNFPE